MWYLRWKGYALLSRFGLHGKQYDVHRRRLHGAHLHRVWGPKPGVLPGQLLRGRWLLCAFGRREWFRLHRLRQHLRHWQRYHRTLWRGRMRSLRRSRQRVLSGQAMHGAQCRLSESRRTI